MLKLTAFKIAYPLELQSDIPKVKKSEWKAANVEALADLNKQLRLYGISDAILTIDYILNPSYETMAKRYFDYAMLEYTKNAQSYKMLSTKYIGLAGNIKALADYIYKLRTAENHQIILL